MTDSSPRTESQAQVRAESRAQAAAARRRWITLGEVLTVIALLISGLTFWTNWTQRRADEAHKAAEENKAAAHSATLIFTATDGGKGELVLKPASGEQAVQDQHIVFPTALDVSPADTTGKPRIDAAWFEHALVKARAAAHLPDNSHADAQLPVAITTHFVVDGDTHEDVALYNIGYSVTSGLFGSHSVTLRGISLIARVKPATAQAQLDARWAKILPHAAHADQAALAD